MHRALYMALGLKLGLAVLRHGFRCIALVATHGCCTSQNSALLLFLTLDCDAPTIDYIDSPTLD
jgi:hypothetical protein